MSELYEVSRVNSQKIYPTAPLREWFQRQTTRLIVSGSSWKEWCEMHGLIESTVRKRIFREEFISYIEIDDILTPAGMRPEDLYGWT